MLDTCGLVGNESFNHLFGRSDDRALRILAGIASDQVLSPVPEGHGNPST